MLENVQFIDKMDQTTYTLLWSNLRGITEVELDWQPHPKANSARWVLGHLIWFEEWVPDAVNNTGLYLTDDRPRAYHLESLDAIRTRFDAARERYRAMLPTLVEADLERKVSLFGPELTIVRALALHTTHLAGHRYQIRYIRGTYSREHGTRKADFDATPRTDPW